MPFPWAAPAILAVLRPIRGKLQNFAGLIVAPHLGEWHNLSGTRWGAV